MYGFMYGGNEEEEYGHLATETEACREYARNVEVKYGVVVNVYW